MLDDEVYETLKEDLQDIHMSLNENEFKNNVSMFNSKYDNYPDIVEYINEQWFKGIFNNWQIYHNEPGFANSNSNVESFNSVIKRDFTSRKRLNIIVALEKIAEVITYYSTKGPEFQIQPRYIKKIKSIAENFTSSNYKVIRKNKLVSYVGRNNSYILKLDANRYYKSVSCSCRTFLKIAICPHLIGYSFLNNLGLYSNYHEKKEETFGIKTKRGRRPLAEKAFYKDI